MSEPDAIQEHLQRFHKSGDKRALALAFASLRAEFVGPVARFLREPPNALKVEQVLSDVLVDLLGLIDGAAPRAMAPSSHTNPVAWRRLVLLNALRDLNRRSQTYQKAIIAQSVQGVSSTQTDHFVDEIIDLCKQRQQVVALLPKIDPRRRVAVAMELGVQMPLSWLDELANALCLSWSEIISRVRAFEADPHSEATKLQVLYGLGYVLRTARDAYRQTVTRAVSDLKALLSRRPQ